MPYGPVVRGNNAHYKVVISPIMTICVAYRDYMWVYACTGVGERDYMCNLTRVFLSKNGSFFVEKAYKCLLSPSCSRL